MPRDEFLVKLMNLLYRDGKVNVFDFTFNNFPVPGEETGQCRYWAEQLVKEKLAAFTDEHRTTLTLSNYGRYWMLKGGYETYLKEGHLKKDGTKDEADKREKLIKEKEALLESRLKLTHFRLIGFWLSLFISLLGFTLSMFNLYLILTRNK